MHRTLSLVASVNIAVLLAAISGCAQIKPNLPAVQQVISITKETALEPATWVPFTAAAVISVAGVDNEISDWATDNTPVFGSPGSANSASDLLRDTLVTSALITSVFAPIKPAEDNFRIRRVVATALGQSTAAGIVQSGKLTFRRERPNERDDRSFPSGHSGSSFTSAVLIEQNINETIQKPWLRKSIKAGTTGTAAAVAWARVEAGEHFPVDVLFSAALGNLVAKVFYRSLVSEYRTNVPQLTIDASRNNFKIGLNHSF